MPDDAINEAQALLGLADKGAERLAVAIKASEDARTGKDRSHIVLVVIGLYAFSIGISILYLIYRGIGYGDSNFAEISDLIKVAVVPIVTLVIGYYFGSSKPK